MIIRRIAPQRELRKQRVAAYARVSTDTDEQAESFETQVDYYTRLIRQNANWEFCGVYADQGKTATSVNHRPEFQRMIADARERKFDVLLVKAISRFSRNVVDAQKYVHELKGYDVEVRFENEAISSADPASEMMFNLLAATAQEEARNKSEHVRWSYRKLAEQGVRHIGNNRVLGYDEVKGVLTPNQDAWIIRKVFDEYANGASVNQVLRSLNGSGVKRMRSDRPFTTSSLLRLLSNEIYVGDRLLQKNAPHNYLTKRPDPTISYHSHYIANAHEPIISRAIWERTKARLENRVTEKSEGVHIREGSHFLYGKVFCADCGAAYKRRTITSSHSRFKAWNCSERQKGRSGSGCKNRTIRETELLREITLHMGWEWNGEESFYADRFCTEVRRVEICADGLRIIRVEAA